MPVSKQKYRPLAQYGLLVLLTVVFFFLIGEIYQVLLYSPDDITMKNYISGVTTGTPDGHCWFLRYPLSATLACLYRFFPGVEWYDLFFLGCLAGCFFLIFQRVFHMQNKINKILYLVISTLLIWMLFAVHVINLEWTTTAGILGATGVFRYVTADENRQQTIWILERVLILGLMLLCFLIRNTVFYLFSPLLIGCMLVKFFAQKKEGKTWKKTLYFDAGLILVCVALLAGLTAVHSYAYSGSEWASYREFTQDRADLFDYYGYPDYTTYQSYYEEAGISFEMYELMSYDYNFLIPLGDNDQVDLGIIADLAKELHTANSGFWERIDSTYTTLRSAVTHESFLGPVLVLTILFCCCFFFIRRNPFAFFLAVAAVGWATLAMLYLAFQGRLPIRVELCLIFGCIAVLGGLLVRYGATQPAFILKFRWADLFVMLLVLGCICLNGYRLYSNNLTDHQGASEKATVTSYCQQHPGDVFLRDFWSLSQNSDLFLHGTELASPNFISTGGWQYQMPNYLDLLAQFGCESVTDAVLEGKSVFYLVDAYYMQDVLARLNRFYRSIDEPVYVTPYDALETDQGIICVLKFNLR